MASLAPVYPLFGAAVHAFLPFKKDGGCVESLSDGAFETALYRYMACQIPRGPLGRPFLQRVRAAWSYLDELTRFADMALLEHAFANGTSPDLVLGHYHARRYVGYVIEVKTVVPGAQFDEAHDRHNKHARRREKTRAQMVEPARLLAQEGVYDLVYAYVLTFSNHRHLPLEVTWEPMFPAVAA